MKKSVKSTLAAVFMVLLSGSVQASVVPDFATNTYKEHELSRAEKKCLEDGYKITYANCSNQTAPADRCPSHDSYYRSCSQEQWCRNNNYRFLQSDCHVPQYPTKVCPNQFPLYRTCQENIRFACETEGYTSKEKCKLSEKKCPYSRDYGICCGQCESFSHLLQSVPEGFIPDGQTCVTCDGSIKTNVRPAECNGFIKCEHGPFSPQTTSCLQGTAKLYSACKTAPTICNETGYTKSSCSITEDAIDCPQYANLKKCTINCLKLAQSLYPQADILGSDVINPVLDLTKKEIRSLVGLTHPSCQNQKRPTINITIDNKSFEQYQNLFERDISDVILKLNYQIPNGLSANGKLQDVKIIFQGQTPPCPMLSRSTKTAGTVSFENAATLCMNFDVAEDSKLLSSGSVKGNIDLGKNSALGLKGDLLGSLKTKNYTNVFIKGKLEYEDLLNNTLEDESIVFGCNSKNKIVNGINANTANVVVKAWAKLDTPSIVLTSKSDNLNLPNSLSSLHLHKYSNIFSTYGNDDNVVIFPLVENDGAKDCDDKYYNHIGSAVDASQQTMSIEPSNRLEDKWKCRTLSHKQQSCD